MAGDDKRASPHEQFIIFGKRPCRTLYFAVFAILRLLMDCQPTCHGLPVAILRSPETLPWPNQAVKTDLFNGLSAPHDSKGPGLKTG